MVKVIFKDEKSLQDAKNKAKGTINYKKIKTGNVIAFAVPIRKKKRLKK